MEMDISSCLPVILNFMRKVLGQLICWSLILEVRAYNRDFTVFPLKGDAWVLELEAQLSSFLTLLPTDRIQRVA